MDKKRLAVNMAAQLLAFAVNMGISFLPVSYTHLSTEDGNRYF